MIIITRGGSRLCDTTRGPWGGFSEGTPFPKARAKGFGGRSPTNIFAKTA